MPIFQLVDDLIFPPAELSSKNGILAVGGDLSPERLLMAYRQGIFPWYAEGEPILWWSPDPRFVLFPEALSVSRSMRQQLKKDIFTVTYDRCFREVIEGCREPRRKESIPWISDDMLEAYCRLNEKGFAHSVEVWSRGKLAGGLYGVSLGRCFFGESMFTRESNASKAALIRMTGALQKLDFIMIDCQVYTDHLFRLGARLIPRKAYLEILTSAVALPTLQGDWGSMKVFVEPDAS